MEAGKKPNKEPREYAKGFTKFLGCRIDLSKRTFIPRPETEFWVARAIAELKTSAKAELYVLDMCAGSGCVGIAVLKKLKNANVRFAEIDPLAVSQIRINVEQNAIDPKRVRIARSDLFGAIPGDAHYDMILANPPYVDPKRIGEVQPSVFNFEPRIALFGGRLGLEVVRKVAAKARHYLCPGGILFLEFDPDQRDKIEAMLKLSRYSHFEFCRDQFDRWRFVKAVR